MKYYRFMGEEEFARLLNGETLHSETKWDRKCRTSSVGFCFLRSDDFTPEEAYLFLHGIVDEAHCVVFETEMPMKHGYGVYADPYNSWGTIEVVEYSTTEYNCETMVPVFDGYVSDHQIYWKNLSSQYDYWEDKYGDLT